MTLSRPTAVTTGDSASPSEVLEGLSICHVQLPSRHEDGSHEPAHITHCLHMTANPNLTSGIAVSWSWSRGTSLGRRRDGDHAAGLAPLTGLAVVQHHDAVVNGEPGNCCAGVARSGTLEQLAHMVCGPHSNRLYPKLLPNSLAILFHGRPAL
jgi:hypothetical protein